ncbi:hypothetical protein Tco_1413736, partial [Tanacetum coccineum]
MNTDDNGSWTTKWMDLWPPKTVIVDADAGIRRRKLPPKIESFIDGVVATPLEKIQEPLKRFVWEFEKKYIKPRKDLQFEDDFLEHDHPITISDIIFRNGVCIRLPSSLTDTDTEHKDMPFLTLMNILSNRELYYHILSYPFIAFALG